MNKHIFFIDPIEKLNIKKDSSLMLALTFHQAEIETYVLFEEDFHLISSDTKEFKVYKFSGEFESDDCYIRSFQVKDSTQLILDEKVSLHMRIDPPFDAKYLRYLWMLDFIKKQKKIRVLNNPLGIMKYNEKLLAYEQSDSLVTYVGSSISELERFQQRYPEVSEWILKPLDLFSGIGVSKHNKEHLIADFQKKIKELGGAIVAQPFQSEVYDGEIRSLYFKGNELGSILKTPPKGSYLSNIAQGAEFRKHELEPKLKKKLDLIADALLEEGLDLIAFDVLGSIVTEVNITCPGLLVEVSKAFDKNLAKKMISAWK